MKNNLILFIAVVCTICSCSSKDPKQLQAGDILFETIDCGPLCDAINKVTDGYKGKDYNHCGLVVQVGDSLKIVEAIGDHVQINPIEVFYKRVGDDTNTIKNSLHARVKKEYQHLIPEACAAAMTYKDLPYDDAFILNNNKMYCSEVLFEAFKKANGGKDIFTCQPMTYKDPETKEFFPPWVEYYKGLNTEIPEGLMGLNPGGISLSDKIEVIE
jgi:uncharacterized protein YycO